MRKTFAILTAVSAAALGISAPPAGATSSTTYHGDWVSAYDCTSMTDADPDKLRAVGGTWRVMLGQDGKAEVGLTMFDAQGSLHAAWGGNYFWQDFVQQDPSRRQVFNVTREDGQLSFVLDRDGVLTFTVADRTCDLKGSSRTYDAVIYGALRH